MCCTTFTPTARFRVGVGNCLKTWAKQLCYKLVRIVQIVIFVIEVWIYEFSDENHGVRQLIRSTSFVF